MEHISQTNQLLIYQQSPFFTIISSVFFELAIGIVFIGIYLFKGPFYWFLNPKYPASRSIALIIGVLMLCLGIRGLLVNSVTQVVFNRPEQKVIVIEKYLIKDKTQEYKLQDIKNVAVIRGDKTAHDYDHNLVLNFNNGTKIQLNTYSEITDDYKSSKDLVRDGQRIANFVGVPLMRVIEENGELTEDTSSITPPLIPN